MVKVKGRDIEEIRKELNFWQKERQKILDLGESEPGELENAEARCQELFYQLWPEVD